MFAYTPAGPDGRPVVALGVPHTRVFVWKNEGWPDDGFHSVLEEYPANPERTYTLAKPAADYPRLLVGAWGAGNYAFRINDPAQAATASREGDGVALIRGVEDK